MDPNTIMIIATGIMAFFTGLIWRINRWQQKQYKSPAPIMYFSEPQVLAVAKKDKKILITFLVYFLNTGLSPIVGTGLEHRIKNLETKEKYRFGETRFTSDSDESFGAILPEVHKVLTNFPLLKNLYRYEDEVPKLLFKEDKQTEEELKVFSPYPYQDPEELWFPEKFYSSDIYIKDYPWIITPHKAKMIRWYIKVPYKEKRYHSLRIKLILHCYCGAKSGEVLKSKEFEIKPITIGDALCFYETIHKEKSSRLLKKILRRNKKLKESQP